MSTRADRPRSDPERGARVPLLTTVEAAAYLNVPVRWVAEAVRQRKIRCTRIGKHVRFRVEHLDELISACEQPVTTPGQPLTHVPQRRRHSGRSRL